MVIIVGWVLGGGLVFGWIGMDWRVAAAAAVSLVGGGGDKSGGLVFPRMDPAKRGAAEARDCRSGSVCVALKSIVCASVSLVEENV